MTGAEYRRHVARARPPATFGEGKAAGFQHSEQSVAQQEDSNEDTSERAGAVPAPGWTLASLWQSVTVGNPRKQLKHRHAKA